MKKNKKALSLVIAISITLVMSLLALYILEYIIPFSKNTKDIEQSVAAYYQADSGIENALHSIIGKDLSYEKTDSLDSSLNRDFSINMEGSGSTLPPIGQGATKDKDFNKISIGNPIQIEIGNDSITPTDFKLIFRVPDLDGDGSYNDQTLKSGVKYINWQIVGRDNILNSEDSQIEVINGNSPDFPNLNGRDLNDIDINFGNFYNDNCKGTGSGCILKFSVINQLELNNGVQVPYIEWKINVGAGNSIPLRYKIINTTGKSYGYRKNLRIKVPQQTLNEAFDFTIFQ